MEKPLDYLTDDDIQIIRKRHFNLDETDDSRDEEINEMDSIDIAGCLCGWVLGSDSWIDSFIDWCASSTGKDYEYIKNKIFGGSE